MSSLADIEHLPKIVTDVEGIKDVLLAIDPEIQLIRDDISVILKNLYVHSADKYIKMWEDDFSLPYDSSLTVAQRRNRVLEKMARKKALTWTNLGILIRRNIINPQYYIVNDSENYHFRIIIQDKDYDLLENAIKKAKPAHLTFDIIVTEYFRRCGTFNCGTNHV